MLTTLWTYCGVFPLFCCFGNATLIQSFLKKRMQRVRPGQAGAIAWSSWTRKKPEKGWGWVVMTGQGEWGTWQVSKAHSWWHRQASRRKKYIFSSQFFLKKCSHHLEKNKNDTQYHNTPCAFSTRGSCPHSACHGYGTDGTQREQRDNGAL